MNLNNEALPANIGDVYNVQSALGHGATMYKPYFDFLCRDWNINAKTWDMLNVKYIVTKNRIQGLELIKHDQSSDIFVYKRKNFKQKVYFESPTSKDESAEIISYSNNLIEYSVNAASKRTLVFSEIYYPGWKAYVDGKRVVISKNDIFRSIDVPPGKHTVIMVYKPISFRIGVLISLGTLIVCGLLAVFRPSLRFPPN